jgi:NAD-dependent DNA ligase
MQPQSGPSSKAPISINLVYDTVADYPDETELCVLVCPVGLQVQLFYGDFALEKAIYGLGREVVDVTHIIYEARGVPQHAIGSFLQDVCKFGEFDISGILYFSPKDFEEINIERAVKGQPTFRYMGSMLLYTLNCGEYADRLRFTPNWSDTIIALPCMSKYDEFLEALRADFEIMDHITTSVKAIDNINGFYHSLRSSKHMTDPLEYAPKSIILFGNDIARRTIPAPAESQVVAEILLRTEQAAVRISSIEAEPDRYGRVRPVIASDEVTRHEMEYYTISLPRLESLFEQGYQVGDVVELKFMNKIPQLGRVVEKTDRSTQEGPNMRQCYSCGAPFQRRGSQLYCPDELCQVKLLNRMLHACSKPVLDIPLDRHGLSYFITVERSVHDLHTLFDLDRSMLSRVYDHNVIDVILNALRVRMDQVQGYNWVNKETQNTAQAKFLDALSLNGLHANNIRKLRRSLWEGDWHWENLPQVLTSHDLLRRQGLPGQDVADIVNSATARLHELVALVKEF